jgi:inorganic phosphate transporter, PiT family
MVFGCGSSVLRRSIHWAMAATTLRKRWASLPRLFTQGYLGGNFHVPLSVVISCHAAMAVGTLIGGWRIVRTMGSRITSIRPTQGACAELGGAITIFMAIGLGTPISTTHTIAGVGVARGTTSVPSGVASGIVFAWVLTLQGAQWTRVICIS